MAAFTLYSMAYAHSRSYRAATKTRDDPLLTVRRGPYDKPAETRTVANWDSNIDLVYLSQILIMKASVRLSRKSFFARKFPRRARKLRRRSFFTPRNT